MKKSLLLTFARKNNNVEYYYTRPSMIYQMQTTLHFDISYFMYNSVLLSVPITNEIAQKSRGMCDQEPYDCQ